MNSQAGILNKIILAYKAEGLKLKRRPMIKLSYLISLLGLVFLALMLMFADNFKEFFLENKLIKFEDLLDLYIGFYMYFMFPVMIAIYTASISTIEREAKTELTLGVLPTSHFIVFLTKITKNIVNTIIGVFIGTGSAMIFAVIANSYLEWFPMDNHFMYFVERIFYVQLGSIMFIPIIILHTWIGERLNVKLLNMFGMMFIGFVTTLIVSVSGTYLFIPHTLPFELILSYNDPNHVFTYSVTGYFVWLIGLLYLVYMDLEKNIFKRKK